MKHRKHGDTRLGEIAKTGISAVILWAASIAAATAAQAAPPVSVPPFGIAPAAQTYGIIDRTGNVIISPACTRVGFPTEGDWISLEQNGKRGFFNLRTREGTGLVFDVADGDQMLLSSPLFGRGPEPVRKGAAFGYVDAHGRTVIPFQFSAAEEFSADGLAVAALNGKFGFIDRRGRFIIPPEYASAGAFDGNGLARVRIGSRWGLIDRRGRVIVAPQYDRIGEFSKTGLAVVSAGDLKGAINLHGDLVIPFKFASLNTFSANGLAAASLDYRQDAFPPKAGHWGFVDRNGAFVAPPVYESVSDFDTPPFMGPARAPEGLAWAISIDAEGLETTHYVDARGRTSLSLPSGLIGGAVNATGSIVVFDARKPHDISTSNRFGLFDPQHADREPIWFDSLGWSDAKGLAVMSERGRWGYIDQTGAVVIQPQFTSATDFGNDGWAAVTLPTAPSGRAKAAFIDLSGKVVLWTPFDTASAFSKAGFSMVTLLWTNGAQAAPYPAGTCGA